MKTPTYEDTWALMPTFLERPKALIENRVENGRVLTANTAVSYREITRADSESVQYLRHGAVMGKSCRAGDPCRSVCGKEHLLSPKPHGRDILVG
jgi:hypothetical protein